MKGEEFIEFPILSPLDTAQFIKGVLFTINFLAWYLCLLVEIINRYAAIALSPPFLHSSTVNKASTQQSLSTESFGRT